MFFHPLRSYPGPWYRTASRLPYTYSIFRGKATNRSTSLHLKYGNVVRIAPDTLSYTCSQAWPGISHHPCASRHPSDLHEARHLRLEASVQARRSAERSPILHPHFGHSRYRRPPDTCIESGYPIPHIDNLHSPMPPPKTIGDFGDSIPTGSPTEPSCCNKTPCNITSKISSAAFVNNCRKTTVSSTSRHGSIV